MPDLFPPKLILCATDYSDSALAALRYANEFARCFKSRLLVLYADSFQPPPYFTSSQVQELAKSIKKERDKANRQLTEWANRQLDGYAAVIETMVAENTPTSAILNISEKENVGLIVMGTHGTSGFQQIMLGSVAERVLHETNRPLLTVRGEESTMEVVRSSLKRILCPVNYSETAFQALDHAAVVAQCFNAELLVLNVVETGKARGQEEELNRQLCVRMTPEQRATCNLKQIVVEGNAAEQIISAAKDHVCGMIVLGARHKRFFDTTVIGTTTVRVTRHSPCPVLTVVHT